VTRHADLVPSGSTKSARRANFLMKLKMLVQRPQLSRRYVLELVENLVDSNAARMVSISTVTLQCLFQARRCSACVRTSDQSRASRCDSSLGR